MLDSDPQELPDASWNSDSSFQSRARGQRIETEDASSNQPARHRIFSADRPLLSNTMRAPRKSNANQPTRFRLAERSSRLLALEGSYSIVLADRSD